tara:strand:+ start:146 stop:781 length:636 start_codon:yes stop_codon:yes gene_type:complete
MIVEEYFKTPIWIESKTEWVDDLLKITDPLIKDAKESNKEKIKINKSDFGIVHHSNNFADNPEVRIYTDYIGRRSYEFLDWMGYDLSNHNLIYTEFWVQEFPKDGGGNHNTHMHPNNHVSGFFYLKCSETSSMPVFHDPRVGHLVSKLPEKNKSNITYASEAIKWRINPGTLIFTPAYMAHEYVVQKGDPFRFIHFNIQAIPNLNKENNNA